MVFLLLRLALGLRQRLVAHPYQPVIAQLGNAGIEFAPLGPCHRSGRLSSPMSVPPGERLTRFRRHIFDGAILGRHLRAKQMHIWNLQLLNSPAPSPTPITSQFGKCFASEPASKQARIFDGCSFMNSSRFTYSAIQLRAAPRPEDQCANALGKLRQSHNTQLAYTHAAYYRYALAFSERGRHVR